ncbi:hypothetical protein [Aurantivibrio plasticivorans]
MAQLSNHVLSRNASASTRSRTALIKQVSRIICHIRDEIHRDYPQVIMPTRKMVEALVHNACQPESFCDNNWHDLVIDTLDRINRATHLDFDERSQYTLSDGKTPLFPNSELFDEVDAHRFSQALLHHLENTLR